MAKVGYARVSTKEQHLERQLLLLETAGCTKIFSERESGKSNNRQVYKQLLDYLREDDEVIVTSLDRLTRNYKDFKELVLDLKERKVTLKILDAPFLNFNTGHDELDQLLFDMVSSLLAYIAESERKRLLERQAQGIEIAKRNGVYKGKVLEYSANAKNPKKRVIYQVIVEKLKQGQSMLSISKDTGVHRHTIKRIKQELKGG